jgi:hypothetical protein
VGNKDIENITKPIDVEVKEITASSVGLKRKVSKIMYETLSVI